MLHFLTFNRENRKERIGRMSEKREREKRGKENEKKEFATVLWLFYFSLLPILRFPLKSRAKNGQRRFLLDLTAIYFGTNLCAC